MCPFIETIRIENGRAINMAFHNYRFNRTRRDIFECNLPVNLADFIQPGEYTERTRCRVEYQEEVEKVEYLPYTLRPVNSLKRSPPTGWIIPIKVRIVRSWMNCSDKEERQTIS